MNNNGKINNFFKLFGIVLIILSLTFFVRAEIISGVNFVSEQDFFCLEDCSSHTQELLVENFGEQKCFDFVLSHNNYLNTSLSNNKFCLNKNESRKMYLNVNTCNADRTFYELKIRDYDNNLEMVLEYNIRKNCSFFGEIEVRVLDSFVCSGEKKDFSVNIKNFSNERVELFLNAENPLLLPYFSREKIILEPFEDKEVFLTINAKIGVGKQSVQLSAKNNNYHIEKRLIVDVIDCSEIKERNFLIETPNVCFDVQKGQIFESSFNVRRVSNDCINCSFNEKTVELSLFGLQNQLSEKIVSLSGTTSKKIYYSVNIPKNISAGTIFLTVSGKEIPKAPFARECFVQSEQICLNVLGTSSSMVNIKTKSKDITWCDSELFELEIINTGDFDETFSLKTIQAPIGVNVSFSQNEITIPKNSSRIVYVSISTNPDSIIAENQSVLLKLFGTIDLEARIYFNIKNKVFFETIEILSNTSIINMNSNSQKDYYLQLRNNSEIELKNLKVSFENVPQGMSIEEKIISSIKPREIITVSGKVIVEEIDGNFSPVFVVERMIDGLPNKLLNKKEFFITVSSEEVFFAGLFGFDNFNEQNVSGENILLGSIGFSILLLILVLLLVFFSSKNVEKESVKEAKYEL